MAELKIIKGDATDPNLADDARICIPHVCNDIGAFGAGFAKALADKWPRVRRAYIDEGDWLLGANIYAKATDNIAICHMIAQHNLIGKDNPHPLRYLALISCMKKVGVRVNGHKGTIHCPLFGSGLAGGSKFAIVQLMKEIWVEKGIDVTVYELP